jgi:hypothetical protein
MGTGMDVIALPPALLIATSHTALSLGAKG